MELPSSRWDQYVEVKPGWFRDGEDVGNQLGWRERHSISKHRETDAPSSGSNFPQLTCGNSSLSYRTIVRIKSTNAKHFLHNKANMTISPLLPAVKMLSCIVFQLFHVAKL